MSLSDIKVQLEKLYEDSEAISEYSLRLKRQRIKIKAVSLDFGRAY